MVYQKWETTVAHCFTLSKCREVVIRRKRRREGPRTTGRIMLSRKSSKTTILGTARDIINKMFSNKTAAEQLSPSLRTLAESCRNSIISRETQAYYSTRLMSWRRSTRRSLRERVVAIKTTCRSTLAITPLTMSCRQLSSWGSCPSQPRPNSLSSNNAND